MDLIHNTAFRILNGQDAGVYRVLLDEIRIGKVAVVRLDPPADLRAAKGGRKRLAQPKNKRKKPPMPLLGETLWLDRDALHALKEGEEIVIVEIEQENYELSEADEAVFAHRRNAMAPFLNFNHFREMLLIHKGIGGLVHQAVIAGSSESFIRKNYSLLCRFGFQETSLRPTRSNKCGAPGVPRPCDPGGRKKAGAKTIKEKIARSFGQPIEPEQPGLTTAWTDAIMAADRRIPTPKPAMPARCKMIIESAFIRRYRQIGGELVPVDLKLGEYPNQRQIKRVLEREIPKLQRLLESTTKGHFTRSLRGLVGKNWQGVVGPGHTWAIDSSIGDIYLRSSVNRAWILGRPIVYVIVDVWSTAVVGFYVCLNGPSWDMAKVALFSATASQQLIGELWGYEMASTLYPAPTMCAMLLCDRGEYLSLAAKNTAAKLIPCMSYAPSYRPDLKGLVEVLHRIEKDQQFFFVPGAIDQRRAEFELRRFDPTEAVLTLPEYVAYLHHVFTIYNLTAPRHERLDAHMHAAGVFPSPAGLWRYGHEAGIGFRKSFAESDLVKNLLPVQTAKVTGRGVRFLGMTYQSSFADEQQWTGLARNFNTWGIDAHYFPGSVSRIWTPKPSGAGLIEFGLSDNSTASPELTFDEVLDAFAAGKVRNAQHNHTALMIALEERQKANGIVVKAKQLTAEAEQRHTGDLPTIREARGLEGAVIAGPDNAVQSHISEDPARSAHQKMVSELYELINSKGAPND